MKKQLLAGAIGLFLLHGISSAQVADVISFSLIRADGSPDAPISGYDPIPAGATINLNDLPSPNVNIRANTATGSVGSVKFSLTGQVVHPQTESTAPYALYGDTSGNYNVWTPPVGSYTLTGQSFPQTGGGGTGGAVYTLNFTVTQTSSGQDGDGTVQISSNPMQWHAVTLTLDGPFASETGTPNPFLNYRMQVTFTNGTKTYSVPGYFAADGLGAGSTASSGNKWRAHLCPDEPGVWTYTISFTQGTNVAVNGGGSAVTPYNGLNDDFTVVATDKSSAGADFRGKGRLMGPYNLERYQRFGGATGPVFIKVGADSPETMLAYADFDNTSTQEPVNAPIKTWELHEPDWETGDATWGANKGKGLIGALNYLASEEINSISFLTYNVGGDGKNVWPFVTSTNRTQYDVSKLAQWNVIFDHADKMGIHLHFKTQERENDDEVNVSLDSNLEGTSGFALGDLREQRKLYYRELIARFSHHLAVTWNLGEENSQSTAQRIAMAQYFYDNDPYRHLVVIHNWPNEIDGVFGPLKGTASKLTGAAIQRTWTEVHNKVYDWVDESTVAGKPWVVSNDEQGPADIGIAEDGYMGTPNQTDMRAAVLWGSLFAGGSGIESYFGYTRPQNDLKCQDYRSRDGWWNYCKHAAAFMRTLPITQMANADELVGNTTHTNGKFCFAKPGAIYCVYLPSGGVHDLDLSGQTGTFSVKWFDPRNGGALQNGGTMQVTGGTSVSLGDPPSSAPTSDWVVLVRSTTEEWIDTSVGSVGITGNSSYDGSTDTFTVEGSGADIYGTSDAFHFVRRTEKLSGDGTIEARVVSVENTNAWAKAGVMIRQTTGDPAQANARNIMVAVTPGNGVTLQQRTSNGGSTAHAEAAFSAPREVRLVRAGTTVTASYKNNSGQWVALGISGGATFTVAANSEVEVGLAVTSHNNSTLCTAVFDGVRVTSAGATEVVMDNGTAGVVLTGAWPTSTSRPGFFGTNYVSDDNAGKGTKKVRFTPTLPTAGTYNVYAWWAAYSNRATAVPITVTHAGGTAAPFYANQQQNGGAWNLVGSYTFNAGTGGYVEISNTGTSGYVIADAVKFVKQ
jgi:hypothetical protein